MEAQARMADGQAQSNAVLFDAFQAMVDVLQGDKTKSEAINRILQLLDLDRQDIAANKEQLEVVAMGLGQLQEELAALPKDGIKSIPKFLAQKESVSVNNLGELEDAFMTIAEALRNQPAPIVNVPEPIVNVPAPVVHVPEPIVNIPETVVNVPEPKVTTKVIVKDWKRDYAFTDSDKDLKKSYYGYIRPDGQWYIMCHRQTEEDDDLMENSTGSARFVFGKKGYQENWKKRTSLKFKYLHEAYLE